MPARWTQEHQRSRQSILNYRYRTLALRTDQASFLRVRHAASPRAALPTDRFAGSFGRGLAGRFCFSLHTVWKALAASLSIPLLVCLGRDSVFHEELSEFRRCAWLLKGI